jgi:FtsH-binding integral membrane protein
MDTGLLKSFALFVAVIVAFLGGLSLFAPAYFHAHSWWFLVYCMALSAGTYAITKKGLNNENFANMVMAATGIRLLLSAVLILIYLQYNEQNKLLFVITFFVLYFLFLGFEIRTLLSKLRQNSESLHKKNEN